MTALIPLFKVVMSADGPLAASVVLRSGWTAQGPQVDAFEEALAAKVCMPGHPIVTVNSGTSALELAYHLIGLGEGDEVLVSPMTCIATALPLLHRKCKIVWLDVDRYTGLVDIDDVERKVTKETKAVVVTDWGGAFVNRHKLTKAAWDGAGREIPIVEDMAHCFGEPDNGRWEHVYRCWSFQAIKFLTTGTDGGALLPPSDQIARARKLRWFGFDRTSKEDFRAGQMISDPGFKWHMSDVAASVGCANMARAQVAVDHSFANARYYQERFDQLVGGPHLLHHPRSTRVVRQGGFDGASVTSVNVSRQFWLYTILVENRDRFVAFMKRRGIECSRVHVRIDRHPCFSEFADANLFGLTYFDDHQVAIPVGLHVTEVEREVIANAVEDWAGGASR